MAGSTTQGQSPGTAAARTVRLANVNIDRSKSLVPVGASDMVPAPDPVHHLDFGSPATTARLRRRHFGVILSFFLLVAAPLIAVATYLYGYAVDHYASTAGFTVRVEDSAAPPDLFGGLAGLSGPGDADADILFEFISSQEMVERLNTRIDLVGHYAMSHDVDPIFTLSPDASIEDLVAHWGYVARVSFNQSNGLIELRVLAHDPDSAQQIARGVVAESQILVNELNARARADNMTFAEADLATALDRLRAAREALVSFRVRTQIVDPAADLQGRMGVLNTLQQQLAAALIDFDVISGTTSNPNDTRLQQAARRIEVIRDRIRAERATFTAGEAEIGGLDYPTLMAEFERLVVDREFAEESYRAALAALDVARANAARQTRYLAVFIPPTLSDTAEFPRRALITALAAVFLTLTWAILTLIYYSLRDRR